MKGAPADWQQALSAVRGIIIHGEERITTQELLTKHLGVAVTDKAARRLRRMMRRLGWRPAKTSIRERDKERLLPKPWYAGGDWATAWLCSTYPQERRSRAAPAGQHG